MDAACNALGARASSRDRLHCRRAAASARGRGAHARTDHPTRDDRGWLNRTLARWDHEHDAPILSYEPVGLLDLPPGDRADGDQQSA